MLDVDAAGIWSDYEDTNTPLKCVQKEVESIEIQQQQQQHIIEPNNVQVNEEKVFFSGFNTGHGQEISVSKKGKQLAQQMLQDVDQKTPREIPVAKTDKQLVQKMLHDDDQEIPIAKKSKQFTQEISQDVDQDKKVKLGVAYLPVYDNCSTTEHKLDFFIRKGKRVPLSESCKKNTKTFLQGFMDDEEKESVDFKISIPNNHKPEITEKSKRLELFDVNEKKNSDLANSKKKQNITGTEIGFTTGHGKKIPITKQSLEMAKNFLLEFENNEGTECIDKRNDLRGSSSSHNNRDQKKTCMAGSSTANKQEVLIEKNSKNFTRSMLQACDTDEEKYLLVNTATQLINCDNEKSSPIKTGEESVNAKKQHNTTGIETGLSTGSGKKIPISKQSLEKAKNCLLESKDNEGIEYVDDISNDSRDSSSSHGNLNQKKTCMSGFNTANGQEVLIEENSKKLARSMLQACDADEGQYVPGTITTRLIGCENEKSSNIKTGEESINAKKQHSTTGIEIGFSTGSGKKIPISKQSFEMAKNFLLEFKDNEGTEYFDGMRNDSRDSSSSHGNLNLKKICMSGFNTVNGQEVLIEENSKKLARSILQACDADEGQYVPGTTTTRLIDCQNEKSSSIKTGEEFNNAKNQHSTTGIEIGFSTGSGKKIPISKQSLEKAKKFLLEFKDNEGTEYADGKRNDSRDSSKSDGNVNQKKTYMSGFSTANGEEVLIEENSKKLAKSVDCENEKSSSIKTGEESNNAKNQHSTTGIEIGFSTGSGKKIPISKQSLEKAKNVLLEFKDNEDTEYVGGVKNDSRGSSSKYGNRVKSIDCESTSSITTDEESTNTKKEHNTRRIEIGFSTGSGEKIPISKQSLEKAKNFLLEFKDNEEREYIDKKLKSPNPVFGKDENVVTSIEIQTIKPFYNELNTKMIPKGIYKTQKFEKLEPFAGTHIHIYIYLL
eukprot:Pgem_evm1s7718